MAKPSLGAAREALLDELRTTAMRTAIRVSGLASDLISDSCLQRPDQVQLLVPCHLLHELLEHDIHACPISDLPDGEHDGLFEGFSYPTIGTLYVNTGLT